MRAPPSLAVTSLGVLLPAVLVFALAYDGGGYSTESRGSWAIGTWWLLALGAALGWWPPRDRSRAVLGVAALLTAFALLTLASALWTTNDADALSEFNRVSFYLGAFLLAVMAASHVPLHRLADGVALGLTAVSATALLSRLAPELVSDRGLAEAFPQAASRLSHPVGYWNGLAILVALAVPLLLRAAAAPRHAILQALAVTPVPAVAATIYLASSRGGVGVALIGALAFLAFSRFRWRVLGAIVAGAAGSGIAVAALVSQSDFVNTPAEASTSTRIAIGLALLLGCVVALALQAALAAVFSGRSVPRSLGIAAAGAAVVFGLAILVLADPAQQLRTFKQPPPKNFAGDADLGSHLASVGGSGRWQFWETAVDAWQEQPLLGQGAGSYEAWWAQHGSLAVFVRDAHSLYLETLAEVGVIGLALLAGLAAVLLPAAGRRVRHLSAARADAVAAATAVVIAYTVAAGFDWVWELPVVTLVAVACLALALAPGESAPASRSTPTRVALAAIATLVVVAQAIPYLSNERIRASQSAAADGDLGAALSSARVARDVQPWAPDPWLQLALVHEQRGELEEARGAIERATKEDRKDWRLWLVAARLETKLGQVTVARASLRRAVELNPRSPLFDSVR